MTTPAFRIVCRSVSYLIAIVTFAVASLVPAIGRDFRVNMLPNGSTFGCATCHTSSFGGGPRNAFGNDVAQFVTPNGRQQFWSEVFSLDSDGDGFTNGEELGDPDGDGVRTVGVRASNPGSASSKPAAVNKPPTVSISSGVTGSFVLKSAGLKLSATAADSDGTVRQVEFFANDVSLGIVTSAPYEQVVDLSAIPAADVTFKAVAKDNSGATGTSTVLVLKVREPLKMNAPELKPDGAVEFTWPSLPGAKFVLESSDDFLVWTEVSKVTVDGVVGKISQQAAGAARFYRAREVE